MATTWVLYDGICSFCKSSVSNFERSLEKRNCKIKPLQNETVMKILGIKEGDDLPEMKIIGDDRKVYGGARGIVFLCRKNMVGLAVMGFSTPTVNYEYY